MPLDIAQKPDYAERRRLLAEALRSGEYKQGAGFLSRDGKYCCLGVACEVAIKSGLSVEVVIDTGISPKVWYDNEAHYLPKSVQKFFGFTSPYGEYGPGRSLPGDNDTRGLTFSEIADLIESNPEGLFR